MTDDAGSPFDPEELVQTLAEVLRHQGRTEDASLLESASPSLVYDSHDNWNGGTDFYSLVLDVPPATYAVVEPTLRETERYFYERFAPLTRGVEGAALSEVLIHPRNGLPPRRSTFNKAPVTGPDLDRIWEPGAFRLFLSHCSRIKESVHKLKTSLKAYSISAFVAHEDVAPTLPWQDEIERALHTMDALAALLTPDFGSSKWCDQEVGYALGTGTFTIPVRLGADPYGFIGRHQGLQGRGKSADALAEDLFLLLLNHERTRDQFANVLATQLEEAHSWSVSKAVVPLLEHATQLEENVLQRVEYALANNTEVSGAFGVPARIGALCKRHRQRTLNRAQASTAAAPSREKVL